MKSFLLKMKSYCAAKTIDIIFNFSKKIIFFSTENLWKSIPKQWKGAAIIYISQYFLNQEQYCALNLHGINFKFKRYILFDNKHSAVVLVCVAVTLYCDYVWCAVFSAIQICFIVYFLSVIYQLPTPLLLIPSSSLLSFRFNALLANLYKFTYLHGSQMKCACVVVELYAVQHY